jgi:peptidoglycan glycosyltransferase
MNRALRRVSLICLVLFVLLLVNVNYVQGFEASSLATKPGNGRTFSASLQFQRGSIVTADQKVVAYSKMNKNFGEYQRHYPFGKMYAPVTGYDTLYSQTAIEQAENKDLAGTDPALEVHNLIDLISGKPKKGATVELTVNSVAQQAAWNALKAAGRESAVVAINPKTGAILALASYPSFDPNMLATLDGKKLIKNDKRLLADPAHPLINNAIATTFPPGSTFKIVTSSTAFQTGKVAD